MEKLFIPILLGTDRKGRISERVARLMEKRMNARGDIEVKFFDVADFDIPRDNYGPELKGLFPEYHDAIVKSDGLLIVAPEYNHSYPGVLKSVLDLLYEEYNHKAVGVVTLSAGPFGGARLGESFLPMLRAFKMVPTFGDLYFSGVKDMVTEDGEMDNEGQEKRLQSFLDELVWLAKTMRYGRKNK